MSVGPDEWETYFHNNEPPGNLEDVKSSVDRFVKEHGASNRKIALVTSGGTTVPLESNTVRFVDNFSAGNRGSSSTEYFLLNGYAVIFMHREKSLLPYLRHFHFQNFLDWFKLTSSVEQQASLELSVSSELHDRLVKQLSVYEKVKKENRLLHISFTTVTEYLFLLKAIAKIFDRLGAIGIFYLAAAVSDFYLPAPEMPEHKIQSTGALSITMKQVPKLLSPLVREWAPKAFTVSFKLETNKDLLISKAKQAIERYQHQVVIANQLDTRKRMVVLVTSSDEKIIDMSDAELTQGQEIEQKIVEDIVKQHNLFIASS
ncbi:phosphopantothenate--cysteine ligase-like [Dysidea avara]|uniref:phosphopantothenate--cysteine ligase-like n=1 Tax=Dysidea avara TaxID=196820 RepID=UPI00332A65F3